jgi:hypothetical protein
MIECLSTADGPSQLSNVATRPYVHVGDRRDAAAGLNHGARSLL